MPAPQRNTLRKFADADDLFDTCDNEIILAWVNNHHGMKKAQKAQGERYRVKQQILAKLATERLDADEMKRVWDEVFDRVEEEV